MTSVRPLGADVLEQRLAEAEATIAALVSGQVDAVLAPGARTLVLLERAQDALRASEESYRDERNRAQRYLDNAAVLLLELDLQGRVTLINRYACTLLGRTPSELMGRDWVTLCVPAELRDEVRAYIANALGGSTAVVENAILTKLGEWRLIEWRPTIARDDDGTVVGTFSSGTDITARQHAVAAVRVAEERTRFALESARIGIWDADFVTGVTNWSDIMMSQYGLEPGTFGGTFEAFAALIHPADREATLGMIERAMRAGGEFRVEHRAVHPSGEVRWLSGIGRVVLGADGKAVRVVGISQDVTERRSLELQFQQAQKMEAVGQLASGVAHDFNNMLSVILGWSSIARSELPAAHQLREALDEIISAAKSAAGLTRQLLTFARQQLVEPTVFDPNTLLLDTEWMLRSILAENIELVTRIGPDVGNVRMDRGQLEQVLMNLVVNARDAMPDGGRILVETASVAVDAAHPGADSGVPSGTYVRLAVTDTGTGMTDEVKARIFEPFFTTKERDKGTGLGLSTCFGVVTQAGGHITVDSAVGAGTTMKLYLPLSQSEETVPVTREPAPLHGTETILLVEDDTAVRRVTKRMLETQGYQVSEVASGDAALARLEDAEWPIHLVLTDVMLGGGMNGRELSERSVARYPHIPVLFASGYTDDEAVVRRMREEGIGLVQKPFTEASLGRRVREALDRS